MRDHEIVGAGRHGGEKMTADHPRWDKTGHVRFKTIVLLDRAVLCHADNPKRERVEIGV